MNIKVGKIYKCTDGIYWIVSGTTTGNSFFGSHIFYHCKRITKTENSFDNYARCDLFGNFINRNNKKLISELE